jgi:DNA-binding IclR family transcriptional regulator
MVDLVPPEPKTRSPIRDEDADDRAIGGLAELLSSRVRATLLAWLAPRLDTAFSLTDLARGTGLAISSLQHECYKLERVGVLTSHRTGQSRHYRLELGNHVARALVGLAVAVLGLERVMAEAAGDQGTFDTVALAIPLGGRGRPVLVLAGKASLTALDTVVRRCELVLGSSAGTIELAFVGVAADHATISRLIGRLAGYSVQPIHGTWPPDGN